MKVIILAGGLGSRLSEYTEVLPKPMVHVGGKPILWHIMQHYARYGHSDFFLALGYKAEIIKEYFLNYHALSSDFTVDLADGSIIHHQLAPVDWRVTLVHTGDNSMTGGRVRRMRPYIGNDTFMLTYGDGVSDIDLDQLLAFHRSHGKLVTVSAVRPSARFGLLQLQRDQVKKFTEKPQLEEGWINGGFFVVEPEFLEYIVSDETVFERDPLERAAAIGELMAYRHEGFWQCMDTKRDKERLDQLLSNPTFTSPA